MLKNRILSTLRFFDLQDTPLTLLELHKFLLADLGALKAHLGQQWEIVNSGDNNTNNNNQPISIGRIIQCINEECQNEVEQKNGFYAFKGRVQIIDRRLENYLYGIRREQLIKKYLFGARHIPFVRGIGLVGSQVLGQQKKESDIDLLILVKPGFMWLARILVTIYFQLTGHRRYGKKIANRFCLNHYLSADKELDFDRNLYTAAEYLKMRPLIYSGRINNFRAANGNWIKLVFPHAELNMASEAIKLSRLQQLLELLLGNKFGFWLESQCKNLQSKRINAGEFIVASDDELSFHPNNRKKQLFHKFFQTQGQVNQAEIPNA